MTEAIIVTGRRIITGGVSMFWGYGFDETGGYSPYPQLFPETGEGGAPWEDPEIYETHNALCQTPADAAKSISNTIMATETTRGANNWTKYEYGTLIVKMGDRYGAYNNRVQTDWQNGGVNLTLPAGGDVDLYAGLVHSHPAYNRDYYLQLEDRYPSNEDIDRIQQLIDDGKMSPDASAFILDPFGKVREFPSSQFSVFRNMTSAQRQEGMSLPAPITTANCTAL